MRERKKLLLLLLLPPWSSTSSTAPKPSYNIFICLFLMQTLGQMDNVSHRIQESYVDFTHILALLFKIFCFLNLYFQFELQPSGEKHLDTGLHGPHEDGASFFIVG
ncbi:uncharacterized protein LOC119984240 [Tripterygium wilfordii]|uniref:uncharacterized protein LOC119984240 n=1 Tax=Tripterygium wilfordii TaxID=458696 RepID=UPI0018F8051D|nr:uncharacterized protein LOC119984240 [Tripterygium wilfordii]